MAYERIIVEQDGSVQIITLNRPDSLNALNSDLLAELSHAIGQADANNKTHCLVITGSDKAFAAGVDIGEMAEKTFADMYRDNMFIDEFAKISKCRKPIIAAVAGYALGGGCELAMRCDIIIAAHTAKFSQPEINLGVIAGLGGTQNLPRFIGKSKAMDMHLTGRFMEAEEAERTGLISRIVPAEHLRAEAVKMAHKIAEKSLPSVMAAKEAINHAYETNLSEGMRFENRLFCSLFSLEDQKEGMAAFLEKRHPHFRNK